MIRRTTRFVSSLTEQALYLEMHASEDVALRFSAAVEATASFLEQNPRLGRAGGFRAPKLSALRRWRIREFPNHLLMYTVLPDGINLVSVVYAGRDFDALLSNLPETTGGLGDYEELVGVRTWHIAEGRIALIAGEPARREFTIADEELWSEVRRQNPRVHDGPILRVDRFHPESGEFCCVTDSYKALAIQQARRDSGSSATTDPFDPSLIWLLGVKGWIVGKDRHGNEHLLIARRGPETRIYGMMWESAPAGGVKPLVLSAADRAAVTDLSPFVQTLAEEADEELGLTLDWSHAKLLGVAQDSTAMSYDVFFQLELPGVIDPRKAPVCQTGAHAWEYVDSAWLAKSDAAGFDRQSPDAIVPAVRAMMRVAGLV